ncbi:hypothetical protein FNF28_00933 [Cafeteria roenbergensis]|uniref:Ion transport domain-containing protein n=1 Tax=Cafeteria roenbergensis TaxID=33653 RepID=A0A5A8E2V8_CAFRO|nr:hypothetical protein FNF28_00933 [Cafeteria roenbergensis]
MRAVGALGTMRQSESVGGDDLQSSRWAARMPPPRSSRRAATGSESGRSGSKRSSLVSAAHRLRYSLFICLADAGSSHTAYFISVLITFLIVLSCITFSLETLPVFRVASEVNKEPYIVFELIERIAIAVFTVEYVLRLLTYSAVPREEDADSKLLLFEARMLERRAEAASRRDGTYSDGKYDGSSDDDDMDGAILSNMEADGGDELGSLRFVPTAAASSAAAAAAAAVGLSPGDVSSSDSPSVGFPPYDMFKAPSTTRAAQRVSVASDSDSRQAVPGSAPGRTGGAKTGPRAHFSSWTGPSKTGAGVGGSGGAVEGGSPQRKASGKDGLSKTTSGNDLHRANLGLGRSKRRLVQVIGDPSLDPVASGRTARYIKPSKSVRMLSGVMQPGQITEFQRLRLHSNADGAAVTPDGARHRAASSSSRDESGTAHLRSGSRDEGGLGLSIEPRSAVYGGVFESSWSLDEQATKEEARQLADLRSKAASNTCCRRAASELHRVWQFVLAPLNIVDLLAIVPFYIELFAAGSGGVGLTVFRILRLGRVFRIFKLGKSSATLQLMAKVMVASVDALSIIIFFIAIGVILFGALIWIAEGGEYDEAEGAFLRLNEFGTGRERTPFDSIPATAWFVIVTLTTLGYGDQVPTSTLGRFIAGLLALVGILVLALPVTILGANFAYYYSQDEKEKQEAERERFRAQEGFEDDLSDVYSQAGALDELALPGPDRFDADDHDHDDDDDEAEKDPAAFARSMSMHDDVPRWEQRKAAFVPVQAGGYSPALRCFVYNPFVKDDVFADGIAEALAAEVDDRVADLRLRHSARPSRTRAAFASAIMSMGALAESMGPFSWLALIGGNFALQWAGFGVAVALQTERFYDIFLVYRISRDGGVDKRFAEIRINPVRFFVAWTLQALWILTTALPVYAVAAEGKPSDLAPEDLALVALWGVFFVIEAAADYHKLLFTSNPANKGQFIRTGLWAVSQHPNYAGELGMWWTLAAFCVRGLGGPWVAILAAPLFETLLLLFVSGIPLLDKAAAKKWGDSAEYKAYTARTAVLVPFLY